NSAMGPDPVYATTTGEQFGVHLMKQVKHMISRRAASINRSVLVSALDGAVEVAGGLIARAIDGDLVIPDFARFATELCEIYEELLGDDRGAIADYIPQLRNVDPDQLAITVCTVDGQRFAIGQSRVGFCVQSVSKPINYCL